MRVCRFNLYQELRAWWSQGTIIAQTRSREYFVDIDGSRVRQNRRHIRKKFSSIFEQNDVDSKNLGEEMERQTVAQNIDESGLHAAGQHDSAAGDDVTIQNEGEYWTRFGRVVHQPRLLVLKKKRE